MVAKLLHLLLRQVLNCLTSMRIFYGVLLHRNGLITGCLVGIHINDLLLRLLLLLLLLVLLISGDGVHLLFLRAHWLEDLLSLIYYLVVHINWLIHN